MSDTGRSSTTADPPQVSADAKSDVSRMSFGEHLEELRVRLIRGLVGLVIGTVVSLIFARRVVDILNRPLLEVLHAHNLQPSLLAVEISGPFLIYLKIGMLCGLILSMPWMVHQGWLFVAAGLYRNERRFARLFGPVSGLLFAAGVAFMYFVVLPIVLNFFVSFNMGFFSPELERGGLTKLLLGDQQAATTQPVEGRPAGEELLRVPVLDSDPVDPLPGAVWVNSADRRLLVQTSDGVLSLQLEQGRSSPAVRSEFGLRYYVSFVLTLSLAFGIAFELPVAVVFLAMTGIVTTTMMAKSRRYVIFCIFIATAILTPPDVISQVLLALPMIVLFEGGLQAARLIERRTKHDMADGAA